MVYYTVLIRYTVAALAIFPSFVSHLRLCPHKPIQISTQGYNHYGWGGRKLSCIFILQ